MGWQAQPPNRNPPFPLHHYGGRYYAGSLTTGTPGTGTIAKDVLFAVPIFIPYPKTYTNIAVEVTLLQAASSARLGIYQDNSGMPGALAADCGTVSCAATGAKGIGINVALTPGWYWLAIVTNVASIGFRSCPVNQGLRWLGYTSGTDSTVHPGVSVAQVFGALPNPFTAGATLLAAGVPRIMLSP